MADKLRDVRLHGLHIGLLAQEFLHRGIFAGKWAQTGVVERVGQHAHVKHVIGIQGQAVFEAEGLKNQRQLVGRGFNKCLDVVLQLRPPDVAGVDHVGAFAQAAEQFTLVLNHLGQGPAIGPVGGGQRVAAARFREPPHQGGRVGIQKQRVQLHALALTP